MVYLCLTVYHGVLGLTVYHGVLVSDCVSTAIILNGQSSKDYIELYTAMELY